MGNNLILLPTTIPRNFVVKKWVKLVPILTSAGNWAWGDFETTAKNTSRNSKIIC